MYFEDLLPMMECEFRIPGIRSLKLEGGKKIKGEIIGLYPPPPKNFLKLQKVGIFFNWEIKSIDFLEEQKEKGTERKLHRLNIKDIKNKPKKLS